ncbi:MAG: hypothetical protein NZ890_14070 [Myxococcota bacterium]|nr:hypothetical protein [Myxococcota bacterium]
MRSFAVGTEAAPRYRKPCARLACAAVVTSDRELPGGQRREIGTAASGCLLPLEWAGPDGALVRAAERGPGRAWYCRPQ